MKSIVKTAKTQENKKFVTSGQWNGFAHGTRKKNRVNLHDFFSFIWFLRYCGAILPTPIREVRKYRSVHKVSHDSYVKTISASSASHSTCCDTQMHVSSIRQIYCFLFSPPWYQLSIILPILWSVELFSLYGIRFPFDSTKLAIDLP